LVRAQLEEPEKISHRSPQVLGLGAFLLGAQARYGVGWADLIGNAVVEVEALEGCFMQGASGNPTIDTLSASIRRLGEECDSSHRP